MKHEELMQAQPKRMRDMFDPFIYDTREATILGCIEDSDGRLSFLCRTPDRLGFRYFEYIESPIPGEENTIEPLSLQEALEAYGDIKDCGLERVSFEEAFPEDA